VERIFDAQRKRVFVAFTDHMAATQLEVSTR
jgi:hypothetical protein